MFKWMNRSSSEKVRRTSLSLSLTFEYVHIMFLFSMHRKKMKHQEERAFDDMSTFFFTIRRCSLTYLHKTHKHTHTQTNGDSNQVVFVGSTAKILERGERIVSLIYFSLSPSLPRSDPPRNP